MKTRIPDQMLIFHYLWDFILTEIDDTQAYLQTKGLDLYKCDLDFLALKDLLLLNRREFVDK